MSTNKSSRAAFLAGGAASSGNALQHGLTSRAVFPSLLAERQDAYATALEEELAPRSVLELIFVREIGRHAAALDVASSAEAVALKADNLTSQLLLPLADSLSAETMDGQRTVGAFSADATGRICQYRRAHERGLYRALAALTTNRANDTFVQPVPLPSFESDADCRRYLRLWQVSRPWTCPRCCHVKCCLLSRDRLECLGCSRQFSIRMGTIMEGSRLPLVTWFAAILALAACPRLTASELAEHLQLRRRQTASVVHQTVLTALRSPHREVLLAGLVDAFIQRSVPCASRTPALQNAKTTRTVKDTALGSST